MILIGRLLEMEMLAQVAKELETWKLNEQKKFKDDLAKVSEIIYFSVNYVIKY